MIIDVHTHVWESPCHIGEEFIADARAVSGAGYKDIGVKLDRHWEAMQAVDRAVVLGFRARHVNVLVPNEYVAEYVRKHPERLIGFCSVDPQDSDAVEQLEHAVQTLGLRGLKMGPIYQNVAPTDSRFRRIMRRAEELRIPVLIHQGTTFCANVSLEIANPIQLQPLAIEFPRLRMVIAHMGQPWIAETLVLIRKNRNHVRRYLRALLPALAVLQCARHGHGVRGFGPAAAWLGLSLHDPGFDHRGAAEIEPDG